MQRRGNNAPAYIYICVCVCVCLCVGGWEGLRSGIPTCPPGDMVKIDPRHSLQSEISSDYLKERRKALRKAETHHIFAASINMNSRRALMM